MLFTDRSVWTMIHGMVLGGAALMALSAALFSMRTMPAAPTLYGPAGGVSGRTTFGTVAWLVAWGLLHSRWRGREIASRRIYAVTLVLTALGIVGTFPPVWGLF